MKSVPYSELIRESGRAIDYLLSLKCGTPEEWLHEIHYVFRLSRAPDVRTLNNALSAYIQKDAHALLAALQIADEGDPRLGAVLGRALQCPGLRLNQPRSESPPHAIALFGASTFGRRARQHFAGTETITCFFDNDPAKAGTSVDGIPVTVFATGSANNCVLIASTYAFEILLQILSAGTSPWRVVVIPSCDALGFMRAAEDLRMIRAALPQTRPSPEPEARVFDFDGLQTVHDFPSFRDKGYWRAFDRAIQDSDHLRERHWPLHTALFCARNALRLEGDFVECGVWFGFLTTGILTSLDWEASGKRFYLVDTFRGIDESILTDEEKAEIPLEHYRSHYVDNYDAVVAKFRAWKNIEVIRGSVPGVLNSVPVEKICYLSIDMNNASAEVGALRFLWPKVVSGGYVLLDDYGYIGHQTQRSAFDEFFAAAGRPILALPTGQALVIK